MKTQLFILFILITGFCNSFAQKYEANTTAKTLVLESGGLVIEGHTGKSIIIEQYEEDTEDAEDEKEKQDKKDKKGERLSSLSNISVYVKQTTKNHRYPGDDCNGNEDRKKGLTVLNPSGLKDNTGFGLYINDNGTNIEIKPVSRNCCNNIVVKISNTMNITGNINGIVNQNSIKISKISGEIDLSTQYNKLYFDDLSGPIMAKTTYGDVEGSLAQSIKAPISIISAYGLIDLKLQPSPKINVELITPWGNTYVPNDLTIELTEKSDAKSIKLPAIKGKINGGGPLIVLNASYGNIYLRTN